MVAPAAPDDDVPLWEDFLEIFYAPAQVFQRRREDPRFGLALAVFTIATGTIFFLTRSAMEPIMDAEFTRGMGAAMRQNPQITPEIADQMRESMKKWSVFYVVFIPLAPLLTGFVVWVAGKLVDARQELGAAMMVATYGFFPRILEGIVNALQALMLPEAKLTSRFSISLGIGRFLDPATTDPYVLALLGRIDVFSLWVTALIALGLAVTGRISRTQAAIAAGLVWLIGAMPQLLSALRQA